MTWAWGLLAAAALLWPDRLTSWFDGIPLDRPAEAIVIGVVLPVLWIAHSSFLKRRGARIAILALVAWRVLATTTLVQDGWCVRFQPERPYVRDQTGAPHAWDLRADWRSADPACSAIMTRSYDRLAEFPMWFFNLPPAGDTRVAPEDRPPGASTVMELMGFLRARDDGVLAIDAGPGVRATLRVDGGPEADAAQVSRGEHTVAVTARLTGDRWRLAPVWNGAPIWRAAMPTVRRTSAWDRFARGWLAWIPPVLTMSLIGAWLVSLLRRVGDPALIAWSATASAALAWLVLTERGDAARWATIGLALAGAVPVARRNRNLRGALLAVGLPWLTYIVVRAAPSIGRFTFYEWGDDFWTFQRYAYRIVLQGYWLEGGSPTFWFQPLYRWIAGLLHAVFGDSSAGELLWDGGCLLAGAIFVFRAVRMRASFGWSVAAAAVPLATFMLGSPRDLIGRGLGEITSAGFVYLAAIFAMRSRAGSVPAGIAAGLCATLAFYTRLNNLPMAAGVAAFALPPGVPVRSALRVAEWLRRVSWRTALSVAGALAIAALLFAWRTWYYTGIFSLFHGTQRQFLALWPEGAAPGAVLSAMADSVLMVVTVNDPPRWDPYALPVLGGAAAAILAAVGLPRVRELPLSLVLFLFASIAGALVARGSAYPGRFSIHVIPVTCAVLASAIAVVAAPRQSRAVVACPTP
jgi:hypothetical protein